MITAWVCMARPCNLFIPRYRSMLSSHYMEFVVYKNRKFAISMLLYVFKVPTITLMVLRMSRGRYDHSVAK